MTELPVATLEGLRVLLVEDEVIIAMEVESMLRGLGCVVVGPVGTLQSAVRLARAEEFDAVILDINLHGEDVFPAMDVLQARGTPFLFATGYGESNLPEKWRRSPRLSKPFRRAEVEALLTHISRRQC